MKEIEVIERAGRRSSGNRKKVKGAMCGCYYCCAVFNGDDVTQFVHQGETAQCPRCGVDSVLAGVTEKRLLNELKNRWFSDIEEGYETGNNVHGL